MLDIKANTHILYGTIKFPPLIDLCPPAWPEPYDIAVSLYNSLKAKKLWESDRAAFDVPCSLPPPFCPSATSSDLPNSLPTLTLPQLNAKSNRAASSNCIFQRMNWKCLLPWKHGPYWNVNLEYGLSWKSSWSRYLPANLVVLLQKCLPSYDNTSMLLFN